jgi:hypothetical protein
LRGFIWKNGVMSEVPDPPLPAVVEIYAVNSAGRLAGQTGGQPTIWKSGIATALAVPSGFAAGIALDLNSQGEGAGVAFAAGSYPFRAVLWSKAGVPATITSDDGYAWAVNDNGEVVGDVIPPTSGTRAFFWNPATGLVLVGNGVWAYDINNSRLAVGVAYVGGKYVAALWTVTITP